MKKILFLLLFSGLSMMVFAQKQFVVDANAEIRSVNESFNAIVVSGGIDIYISQSDREELAISASDDRYKEGIKTIVTNKVLKVYYDGDKSWSSKNKNLKAYISFKELERLEATGASDIIIAGEVKVPSLLIKLTGASDLKGILKVNTLIVNLSGASDARISGTANEATIDCSGASDVKGFEMVIDKCTAKASGASDINITVNKELNANASGASDIYFRGAAVILSQQSSGGSTGSKKK